AISALRKPLATSPSTSSSRAVRFAGFARVDARGPRDAARTAFAETAGDDLDGRSRSERTELVERSAKRVVVVRIRERESRVVRAPALTPQLRRARPIASQGGRVRFRRVLGNLLGDSRLPSPVRE